MKSLKDALSQAVVGSNLVAKEAPAAAAAPAAPELDAGLLESAWVLKLREFAAVPRDATFGRVRNLSDVTVKQLKAQGRDRDARELAGLASDHQKKREAAAWADVKALFAELELPEKAYRALKQEGGDPVKMRDRLRTKRAQEYRGAAAAKVRDWLMEP